MNLKKWLSTFTLLSCALLFVNVASADSISFSLSGSGWSTSGTLSGTETCPGSDQWLVTNATGTFYSSVTGSLGITGVWPTSNDGNIFLFNNIYYSSGPALDTYGIVLTLPNGDLVNLCYGGYQCNPPGNTYTAIVWNGGYTPLEATQVSFGQPVQVPEFSGLSTLLGVGTFNLAAVLGVRRKAI